MGKKKHIELLLALKEAQQASILQQGCEEGYEEKEEKKKVYQVILVLKETQLVFYLQPHSKEEW